MELKQLSSYAIAALRHKIESAEVCKTHGQKQLQRIAALPVPKAAAEVKSN